MHPPLVVIVLMLLSAASTLSSTQHVGLDSFLSSASVTDPNATDDSFSSLPSHLKRSLSTKATGPLRSSVLSFTLEVPVHVKLVGSSFSSHSPATLLSLLSASRSSSHFQVIGSTPLHSLFPSHSLHADASLAPTTLLNQLSHAVRSHISPSPTPHLGTSLHTVPFNVVDRIIVDDYRLVSSHSAPAYYIYLLDLGAPPNPYAYAYNTSATLDHAFSLCHGTLWTAPERYIWIDLSAGPVSYGPAVSGEGLLSRGVFHSLASLHTQRPRLEINILSDLASLVLGAYRSLLVPSLRVPVDTHGHLHIRIIHIGGTDAVHSAGVNFRSVERTIREAGLLFGDQSLRFDTVRVKYAECQVCAYAVARSMRSFTARFLFDNYTLIASEYLDSKRLHQILTELGEEVSHAANSSEEYVRVLPVYVFDLDYDRPLMLDRFHQSIAFKNMVIAVRTWSRQTVSDYSCNGRLVITQTQELERPIMGSILQSMWGISPTHLSWSPQHNDTLVDYTWSVGLNPFGPFSESMSLSFAQRDAAKRNTLLYSLHLTISNALHFLSHVDSYGGDRKLIRNNNNKHVEFVQRWNFMKYKLDKVVSAMSHFDFEKAAFYLRSSDHDLFALQTLVYREAQKLGASLVCLKDPTFPWGSASVGFGIFLGIVCIYTKREELFSNKRKKF